MKRNKITTAMAAAALAILLGSCADMIWGVDTEAGVGVSDYSPYYGYYNNGIWDNALNGFYGPMWSAPPVYRPPYRPGWNGWNGGNPGPVIPPSNRPSAAPSRPQGNPEGVSGKPSAPATTPSGGIRPGNNGRPQK